MTWPVSVEEYPSLGREPAGEGRSRPGASRRVSVAIIDANGLECEGLVALLQLERDFECVGAWTEPGRAVKVIPEITPQIILLDTKLPGNSCGAVLQTVRSTSPRSNVLCLLDCHDGPCGPFSLATPCCQRGTLPPPKHSIALSQDCFQLAIKAGARGIVRKQESFHELTRAMRAVAAGELWMEMTTATRLVEQYLSVLGRGSYGAEDDPTLTGRERQIVQLIGQGLSNKEIAARLGIAYPTVKNCVSAILRKLDLGDRTQIALYTVQNGAQTSTLLSGHDKESRRSVDSPVPV